MSQILVDTLFPPAPAQLADTCQRLGAAGCWVYCWRPNGNGGWTPAHVAALHGAGLLAPGIVVPGNTPPDPRVLIAAAAAMACDPWLAVDLEAFSLPPAAWVAAFGTWARPAFRPLRYGDLSVLATYPQLDGDWLSHGEIAVRSGTYTPVPALPPACVADQYAVQVLEGGAEWDVSVSDPGVFALGPVEVEDMTDQQAQQLASCVTVLAKLDGRVLGDIGTTTDVGLGYLSARVDQVLAALKTPAPVDVDQLAAALVPHLPPAADPAAIAAQVLRDIGQAAPPA